MATSAAYIDFDEAAAPATPAAGKVRVYAKTDSDLYQKDDTGAETGLAGAGGSASGVPILRHVYQRSAGDYTTTSGTLVAVDATANTMSYDATVAANSRIRVEFVGNLSQSAAVTPSICVALDGTPQQGTSGLAVTIAASAVVNASFVWTSAQLAADTYTVAIYWARGSSGTFTMRADAARFATFAVYEIPA
jgi:hypothetical protein